MNDKWWSVLFGIVMIACGALFVVAPIVGWWMPPALSSHAKDVDDLFYLILWITGFFFILTEALLVVFMYRYAWIAPGQVRGTSALGQVFKPLTNVFNTSYKIEMAWTVVPAVILILIAFVQVNTWAEVKYKSRLNVKLMEKDEPLPVQIELSARQFEWRMRYPSVQTWKKWRAEWKSDHEKVLKEMAQWVKSPQFDDLIHVPNEMHIIKGSHVVVQLSTKDVIHSLNLPHMRVKQDALPGKVIPVWFKPLKSNVTREKDKDGKDHWWDGDGISAETGQPNDPSKVWQIACAELCGWGHYRMIGRAYVHDNEDDFLAWLAAAEAKQHNFGSTSAGKN